MPQLTDNVKALYTFELRNELLKGKRAHPKNSSFHFLATRACLLSGLIGRHFQKPFLGRENTSTGWSSRSCELIPSRDGPIKGVLSRLECGTERRIR